MTSTESLLKNGLGADQFVQNVYRYETYLKKRFGSNFTISVLPTIRISTDSSPFGLSAVCVTKFTINGKAAKGSVVNFKGTKINIYFDEKSRAVVEFVYNHSSRRGYCYIGVCAGSELELKFGRDMDEFLSKEVLAPNGICLKKFSSNGFSKESFKFISKFFGLRIKK